MDIILSVFLAFLGIIFTAIGIPRKDATGSASFFLGIAASFFIFLGILTILDPLKVIAGVDETDNTTIANITQRSSTFVYAPIDTAFNIPIALLFILLGGFLFFYAVSIYPKV